MHWNCGIVTKGKPTEEQLDKILEQYYGGDFDEDFGSIPIWDWYVIGGRWAGLVMTPADKVPDSTLIYGRPPMAVGFDTDDNENKKKYYYTGLELTDDSDKLVLCNHSDGAYVADIIREAWDNEEQKTVPLRTYALIDINGEYHEADTSDGISMDTFNELVYNTGCNYAYLTIVDLHM